MRLIDHLKFVTAIPPGILATTVGDADYVSLKDYTNLTIVLTVDNGSTVTGTAITLKQATLVDGTDEKALAFDKVWANIDTGAADTLVETAVTSDTFTTDTTDAKNLKYVIEITEQDLDMANDFTCVRLDALLMANALGNVEYILSGSRNNPAIANSAITD